MTPLRRDMERDWAELVARHEALPALGALLAAECHDARRLRSAADAELELIAALAVAAISEVVCRAGEGRGAKDTV